MIITMADLTIWIEGREKRVSGLSKKTTCSDILKTLLRTKNYDQDEMQNFTIYERWGDCERPLSPRTKIYKIWKAWGNEQPNVKFTLRKTRSSKHSGGGDGGGGGGRAKRSSDGQREHYEDENRNKVYRSKHKSRDHHQKEERESKHVLETLESLIHVVIMQDHKIQELVERIQQTDDEIEYYETQIHVERQKENGKNYVQESYLTDAEDEDGPAGVSDKSKNMDSYITACEKLLQVDQELVHKETLIEELSRQLEEESLRLGSSSDDGSSSSCADTTGVSNCEADESLLQELSRLRQELEKGIQVGQEQRKQLQALQHETLDKETVLDGKRKHLEGLTCELRSLENSDDDVSDDVDIADFLEDRSVFTTVNNDYSPKEGNYDNESDADTGLSSMHSQDDDAPIGAPVVETLV
ncbi:ras association domain-containing protein 10-like isoform X2 [Ptychodera flava]|uniref:ras association domain-containing protein 10-like isoform X2 n=1 Tax=Ptychodera flava TaxID=63121 RepID=UPI00396AAC16